jgi:beta-glucosidase-like glycosyl hydrolase
MYSQVSDGPSGARGEIFGENVPAAFFPSGASLGATWDTELLEELGHHLAEEVGHTVLYTPRYPSSSILKIHTHK